MAGFDRRPRTRASLKNALSNRTSSVTAGRTACTASRQLRMKAAASRESWTLPGRWAKSRTWPVWATVQNSG